MANSPLITKSKEFALQIIKVCNYMRRFFIISVIHCMPEVRRKPALILLSTLISFLKNIVYFCKGILTNKNTCAIMTSERKVPRCILIIPIYGNDWRKKVFPSLI